MNPMSMDRDEPSSLLSFSTNHPLEQFVLLAKGAKGSACAELIKQVLEAPGVHVFGELLEMPNIIEVRSHCVNLYLLFILFISLLTLKLESFQCIKHNLFLFEFEGTYYLHR